MFVFVQLSVSSSSLDISKWFLLISTSPYNTFTNISKPFKVKHNVCIPTLYNWDINPVPMHDLPQMMHCFSFCFSYSFPFQMQFLLTFFFLIGWLACLFSNSFLTGIMVRILLLALCTFLAVRLCWLPSESCDTFFMTFARCCPQLTDKIQMSVTPLSE